MYVYTKSRLPSFTDSYWFSTATHFGKFYEHIWTWINEYFTNWKIRSTQNNPYVKRYEIRNVDRREKLALKKVFKMKEEEVKYVNRLDIRCQYLLMSAYYWLINGVYFFEHALAPYYPYSYPNHTERHKKKSTILPTAIFWAKIMKAPRKMYYQNEFVYKICLYFFNIFLWYLSGNYFHSWSMLLLSESDSSWDSKFPSCRNLNLKLVLILYITLKDRHQLYADRYPNHFNLFSTLIVTT